MKISTINTGFFKLDGGAMFGIVPKRMWQKLNPPDENNLTTWAMRCLLVQTEGRNILIDTGLGDKQDDKFRSHFEPFGEDSLLNSLLNQGLKPEDITDVLLTHLHFDHVGGAVKRNESGELVPTFPNAKYWSNQKQWDTAMNPNPKEAASFLRENFIPLQEHGVLHFLEIKDGIQPFPGVEIRFTYGHTDAMMIPIISSPERTYMYCADTIPAPYHARAPYVLSYDIRPLVTMEEKKLLLEEAYHKNWTLIFEHDPISESGTVHKDEKGNFSIVNLQGLSQTKATLVA
jgi:glyoxylase-like metal-dependent hydrolase (beta-lactamase superfamily II)